MLNIGPSEDVTHELNVDDQTWTGVGGQSGVVNGSSIQYLPGKILYSGGASSVIDTEPAKATTAVLDTDAANPTWTQTAPMLYPRDYHTLTMLANVQVIAVGGEQTRDQSMADNVQWIAAHNPGSKIVLWAHNGHIKYSNPPGFDPMGGFLHKKFGQQLVNFGFSFNEGSFRAI